jgi:pyocin large subunit-like protein
MAGYKIALSLGASLILLAACERPSAVAAKGEAPRSSASSAATSSEVARADERRAEPVRQIDGKPIWSASRRGSAEENAQRSFERNGEAFGARDLDAFVRKAHDFVENPPAGTERLTRANGDVLLYDPKANIFAVVTEAGAPRTMFKPDEGAAYWQEQKTRESRRQTARADRRESDDS